MAKGDGLAPRSSAILAGELRWTDRLQFKLGALFAGLLLVLGSGALLAGRLLVRDGLVEETFRYEFESARRLAAELGAAARDAEQLAATLARLSLDTPGAPESLATTAPRLADRLGGASLVDAIGIWPEPRTLQRDRERASLYWVRGDSGRLELRRDYNDARIAPYWREKWATPARHGAADRCWWSPPYVEALTRRRVITCALPLRADGRHLGAVTVSLALDGLAAQFAQATQSDPGYSLLVDEDSRLLALSANAAARLDGESPDNLAELAQRWPALSPLALALFRHQQERNSTITRSSLYEAREISALREATRELSRDEAEGALLQAWSTLGAAQFPDDPPRQVAIEEDPLLDGPALAASLRVPGAPWRLVRVTSATEGFSGARYVFTQTLVVVGGAVVLALLLAYLGLRRWVTRPLSRMTRQLSEAHELDEALLLRLDEGGRDEVGALSFWHNERTRQLRELMERSVASRAQLQVEADERRRAQDQLARVQERMALALQAVSDGVLSTDDAGAIVDMNPAAELLTGMSLSTARARKLGEVVRARHGALREPLPDLAALVLQRGAALEYAEQVVLDTAGGAELAIQIAAQPIRSRLKRVTGALIVIHKVAPNAAAATGLDAVTGLATRQACDRRLRTLLDSARLAPHRHAVLFVDVDNLKRVNDAGGRTAGDQVLARVAEALVAHIGAKGEAFRLRADDFAVVLEDHDAETARALAEKLRDVLAHTRVTWDGRKHAFSASFGIAVFDGSEDGAAEVLRRADDACAAAKRAGRNTVKVYEPAMDRGAAEPDDGVWQRRIRAGLDHNLFHLTTQFVQPAQAYAAEGAVFELLLSLEDEEGFWAAPNAFLPAAERHHLLPEMDRWVVARTLDQLARQPETVERLAFASINVSGASLADGSLLEFIVRELERRPEIAPARLCFELSEQAVLEHPQQARVFCEAMRSIGCRLAIDHFQARRAADLTVLRALPFDLVKIDAQEYRAVAGDALEQQLAETVIRVARTLRRRVIVANIDDPRAWATWKRLGADYFQGFAVAKPSPITFLAPST